MPFPCPKYTNICIFLTSNSFRRNPSRVHLQGRLSLTVCPRYLKQPKPKSQTLAKQSFTCGKNTGGSQQYDSRLYFSQGGVCAHFILQHTPHRSSLLEHQCTSEESPCLLHRQHAAMPGYVIGVRKYSSEWRKSNSHIYWSHILVVMDKEWDYQMFRSAWFNLNLANFCWTSASRQVLCPLWRVWRCLTWCFVLQHPEVSALGANILGMEVPMRINFAWINQERYHKRPDSKNTKEGENGEKSIPLQRHREREVRRT